MIRADIFIEGSIGSFSILLHCNYELATINKKINSIHA